MAKQMEHSMPASMQRYITPYMEQHIMAPQPYMDTTAATSAMPHMPINPSSYNPPRQTANISPLQSSTYQPQQPQAQIIQPPTHSLQQPSESPNGPQVSYATAQAPIQPYDFITNPDQPPKQSKLAALPGGNSIITRVGVVAGGLLVLVIIFSIVKGLLSSGSNLPLYMAVLEDQQALIHLATNANMSQTNLTLTDQNFTATAQLSLSSNQAELITLLQANKLKINPKLLNAKVSTAIDTQLTNAETAGTYDQTYQTIMQNGLVQYQKDLNTAYQKSAGTKGGALLKSDNQQAGLLLEQLGAATN
jgi:hypothetical protein